MNTLPCYKWKQFLYLRVSVNMLSKQSVTSLGIKFTMLQNVTKASDFTDTLLWPKQQKNNKRKIVKIPK